MMELLRGGELRPTVPLAEFAITAADLEHAAVKTSETLSALS